ncbi:MAG: ACP S-malonyltransferase [Pseudomonadota bacterium]
MRRDLAFLFPGQGSQRVAMLAQAADRFKEVHSTFEEASEALGFDLWDLIQSGDATTLNLTENTQPALLTSSVALWRAWLAEGGDEPAAMAGHSLGEFSALCCAGSLNLPDAVTLVRARGQFMQNAVPLGLGSMAAVIGLDDEQVLAICDQVAASEKSVVQAVNFNSPGQVVIAGYKQAVNTAIDKLKSAGAKLVKLLPVSAPFHTTLMTPAGEQLLEALAVTALEPPRCSVVHNVHAQSETDPEKIRALLVEQISSPVRWTACIARLRERGASTFVECGPGKVLGGLLRRMDRSSRCHYVEEPDNLTSAAQELKQ